MRFSKALMNISRVLPMVKDLDGFLNNLTSVTSALQIAFDSTLLALFLSAALMLAQTLVYRRAEDLLARVDRPIGVWLLFLPGLWGILLSAPPPREAGRLVLLFAIGSLVMRAAGCVVNDLWDRDIDRKVARTAGRPITGPGAHRIAGTCPRRTS